LKSALDLPAMMNSMIEDVKKKSNQQLNQPLNQQITNQVLSNNQNPTNLPQDNGSSLKATPKITASTEPKPANSEAETMQIVKESDVLLNKTINETELVAAWNMYAEQIKQMGKNLAAASLTAFPITLKPNNIIELPLKNLIIEENSIKDIRDGLVLHLRKTLQNSTIQVQTIKATIHEEAPKKIYTSQDKFKKLVEKFPIVAELKTLLGLDYDF
jgi:hypothetical protein